MQSPAILGWRPGGLYLEIFEISRPENAISCNLRMETLGVYPQKILKFQGLKMQFPAIQGQTFLARTYSKKGHSRTFLARENLKFVKIKEIQGVFFKIKEIQGKFSNSRRFEEILQIQGAPGSLDVCWIPYAYFFKAKSQVLMILLKITETELKHEF